MRMIPFSSDLGCRHEMQIPLFRPQSATRGQAFTGWLWGMQAEYADGAYPGLAEGRELTRTVSAGHIKLEITTMTKVCLPSCPSRWPVQLQEHTGISLMAKARSVPHALMPVC